MRNIKTYLKRIRQSVDYSTMESGDHFKNGASPKSLMSKENLESLCMQKINYLCTNF
jgi:hypothetical protein